MSRTNRKCLFLLIDYSRFYLSSAHSVVLHIIDHEVFGQASPLPSRAPSDSATLERRMGASASLSTTTTTTSLVEFFFFAKKKNKNVCVCVCNS